MTTILAVDDSATMRKCLEITFAGSEFELVTVDSAQAALEKVKTASPALVIADVSLPPHDGYELCSTIKLAAPQLPVLMLSSKQNPFDPTRGAQADGHIDKPFDTQVLQDRARALVRTDAGGDTDTPPARGGVSAKPVVMPERSPSSKIPAPRRKRPTPAMMSKPEITTKSQPMVTGRRTVPFAMPGASRPEGESRLASTQPMLSARDREASDALGQAARSRQSPPPLTPERRTPTEPQPTQARQKVVVSDTLPGVVKGQDATEQSFERRPAVESARTEPSPFETSPRPELPRQDAPRQEPPRQEPPRQEPVSGRSGPVTLPREAATDLQGKLETLGLTQDQVNGVLALSRDLLEQVVWEVVPVLAETLIKEEIRRLTRDD